MRRLPFGVIVGLLAGNAVGWAATRSLPAVADNTIFSDMPLGMHVSNGAGPHIYVGTIRVGPMRRGLLRFDVSTLPLGSTVNSAELGLNLSQAALAGVSPMDLHRLSASWGEGGSNSGSPGGSGAPATPGDATWVHRFFDTEIWATQGGDFVAAPSATTTPPAGGGSFSFGGLETDVQLWFDGQAPNNGWLLKLNNESVTQTAQRLDSRENLDPLAQPRLLVNFRGGGDTNGDDLVDIGDFAVLAANFNQPLLGPDNGDFNRDGIVDIGDFSILAANFNLDFDPARRGVPEPGCLTIAGAVAAIGWRRRR